MIEVTQKIIDAVKREALERRRRGDEYSTFPGCEEDAKVEYEKADVLSQAESILAMVSYIQHYKNELGL